MALDILITRALADAGFTVVAESNVAPPITLYDANATGPSLLEDLGIKTRLVVKRAGGDVVASYGAPVTPNYLLAGFLLVVGLAGAVVLGALVGRLVK